MRGRRGAAGATHVECHCTLLACSKGRESTDSFCVVSVAGRSRQTEIQRSTVNCVWDEVFIFEDIQLTEDEFERENIFLHVYEANTFWRNELIGADMLQRSALGAVVASQPLLPDLPLSRRSIHLRYGQGESTKREPSPVLPHMGGAHGPERPCGGAGARVAAAPARSPPLTTCGTTDAVRRATSSALSRSWVLATGRRPTRARRSSATTRKGSWCCDPLPSGGAGAWRARGFRPGE